MQVGKQLTLREEDVHGDEDYGDANAEVDGECMPKQQR